MGLLNQVLATEKRYRLTKTFRPNDFFLSLRELVRRHELVWLMTVRHLKGQYKQSVLGYAWAFVNPLTQMLILSFVFSIFLQVRPAGDVPYPLFLFVGLLPWIFFSSAVASGTDSVVGASSLVTKVYFPREILPIAAAFTKVVDLAFGLLILTAMMIYYGTPPEWTVVWVPAIFLIHLVFTIGLSFPLAALNLFFHDVRFLVGVVLSMWFYLTPVMYPVETVPPRYHILFDLNPNSIIINAYRRVIYQGDSPGLDRLLLGLGVAVVTFVVGYYLFKMMEGAFADRI